MGEPVKIIELAKTMAKLKGTNAYLEGEEPMDELGIPIVTIGLRSGEKLFEELLISGTELQTEHSRIKCDPVSFTDTKMLMKCMIKINKSIEENKTQELLNLLEILPLQYKGQSIH